MFGNLYVIAMTEYYDAKSLQNAYIYIYIYIAKNLIVICAILTKANISASVISEGKIEFKS